MKNYRTLDAIVLVAVLGILGMICWALIFRIIPQANLPILAGLAGTIFGATIGAYAGARWGNKKTDEPAPTDGPANVSLNLTASAPAEPSTP